MQEIPLSDEAAHRWTIDIPYSVREAAEVLDIIRPDWYQRVNLDILNMVSERHCVLGQVYGNAFRTPFKVPLSWRNSVFGYGGTFLDVGTYKQQWIEQITKRRAVRESDAFFHHIGD